MKALTVHQPWASALAFGMKRYETRSRRNKHRGEIAIHAGLKVNSDFMQTPEFAGLPWTKHLKLPLTQMWASPTTYEFPTGAVIATGELVECHEITEEFVSGLSAVERALGDYTLGRFAYQIDNITQVGPYPAQGKRGTWEWTQPDV